MARVWAVFFFPRYSRSFVAFAFAVEFSYANVRERARRHGDFVACTYGGTAPLLHCARVCACVDARVYFEQRLQAGVCLN